MCLIYRKWKTISHVKESPEWEEEKHGIDFYLRREIEWVYFDIAFLKFKKNILKKKLVLVLVLVLMFFFLI